VQSSIDPYPVPGGIRRRGPPLSKERGVQTEFMKIYIPRIFILFKHAPNQIPLSAGKWSLYRVHENLYPKNFYFVQTCAELNSHFHRKGVAATPAGYGSIEL
jgi:hypothetical protein